MREETEQPIQNLVVSVEDSKSFPQISRQALGEKGKPDG
jgi:hypothetical protein